MSLGNCIPGLIAEGKLTAKQGERAQAFFERHLKRLSREMGPVAAAAEASEAALRELEFEIKQKKRQAFLGISAKKAALGAMATYSGREGKFDFGKAAEALLARDDRAPYANVEYRERWRRNQALALMNKVLARHSRNVLGEVRDRAGTIDLLRALRGEATDNAGARELAQAVEAAQDLQRRQFNAAGGAIRKLDNRGVAQRHDAAKVGRAGLDLWKSKILPKLDMDAMVDERSGNPFTPETLAEALDEVFETIRTDGTGRSAPGAGGSAMMANRRREHRFLKFKSTEDWIAYAEEFGDPNVYDAIMDEVHAMARDIAAMEILGPNPSATVRWLKDVIVDQAKKEHGAGGKAAEQALSSADRIDALWGELSGSNARGHRNLLALVGSSIRTWQVATKLGGAVITALPTDAATGALTRVFNGLPVLKMGNGYLKYLASSGTREQAARFGFIAEQASSSFATQARFFGEELSGEFQQRVAEGTLRASGLNIATEAARFSFVNEALSHIADDRGKSWRQLDRRFRGMFERYGFDEAGWDAIRATPTAKVGGADWIVPAKIADAGIADRLMEMIFQEMDMAVITAGIRVRSTINQLPRRGTVLGEAGRLFLQFKAFPITAIYLHGARSLSATGWSAAGYSAAFLGMATVGGYFALQGKEASKGRDLRPMDVKLLLASMQQGGGLGIYGDFLFSSTNRFGQGMSSTALGPSAQTIDAVSGLVAGAPLLQAEGEEVDYDKQLIRLLKSETPVIGSLWYTRLAYERLLLDQWQSQADPKYRQSWNRAERRAAERGQGYWWRPGATMPERAPEMGELP